MSSSNRSADGVSRSLIGGKFTPGGDGVFTTLDRATGEANETTLIAFGW
ncbi:hypothetical protein [Nocardia jejuensis]|nr:hypothetical protein [Nocardia jejuensis]